MICKSKKFFGPFFLAMLGIFCESICLSNSNIVNLTNLLINLLGLSWLNLGLFLCEGAPRELFVRVGEVRVVRVGVS